MQSGGYNLAFEWIRPTRECNPQYGLRCCRPLLIVSPAESKHFPFRRNLRDVSPTNNIRQTPRLGFAEPATGDYLHQIAWLGLILRIMYAEVSVTQDIFSIRRMLHSCTDRNSYRLIATDAYYLTALGLFISLFRLGFICCHSCLFHAELSLDLFGSQFPLANHCQYAGDIPLSLGD